MGAKIVIFQPDFFRGFVPKVLATSVITFDMCFSKFIIETGVWSSCEGDRGNCMQINGKSWQTVEWGEIDGKEVLELSITKLVETLEWRHIAKESELAVEEGD